MENQDKHWDLIILDGAKFAAFDERLMHLVVGDFDGDGYTEICTERTWYRMATGERGILHQKLHFENVQPTVGDLTGDGRLEIICAYRNRADTRNYPIVWYKPGDDMSAPWEMHYLSPDHTACPHDIIVEDIDGDGHNEVVATGVYGYPAAEQGLYIYKAGVDVTQPWQRKALQNGWFADGTSAGDYNGDGIMGVVSGPYLYEAPVQGPFSDGTWIQHHLAPDLRNLCRSLSVDITGNGRPDVIIVEAEYVNCKLCWYENRTVEDPDTPWVEHVIMKNLYASHSLDSWYDAQGQLHILVGETENGTSPIVNYNARVLDLVPLNCGSDWQVSEIYKGQGTWMARAVDADDDGEVEIVGATDAAFACFGVHVWKKNGAPVELNWKHRFIDRERPQPCLHLVVGDTNNDGQEDIACGRSIYFAPDWKQRNVSQMYQILEIAKVPGYSPATIITMHTNLNAMDGAPWDTYQSGRVWAWRLNPINHTWKTHAIADLGVNGSDVHLQARWIPDLLGADRPALLIHSGIAHTILEPGSTWGTQWNPHPLPVVASVSPQLIPADLSGNGLPDLLGCQYWLENRGEGVFITQTLSGQTWDVAAQALMDVNHNGRLDLIIGERSPRGESYTKEARYTRLAWFEQPEDPCTPWPVHVIDHVRGPNSLLVLDVDGDGEDELLVGEHDPHWELQYAHRHLFVYKRYDELGSAWSRHVMDTRFDHDGGLRAIHLANGKTGFVSHGSREEWDHWMNRDGKWLHLWEPGE